MNNNSKNNTSYNDHNYHSHTKKRTEIRYTIHMLDMPWLIVHHLCVDSIVMMCGLCSIMPGCITARRPGYINTVQRYVIKRTPLHLSIFCKLDMAGVNIYFYQTN